MIASLPDLALALAAVPATAAGAYLAVLAVAARRTRLPAPVAPLLRFDVVVPAHDEEAGVEATVKSLLALDYPASGFRVVVVADNCRDATAEKAEAAGARVLPRNDPARKGKGYALAHAFELLLAEGFADAFVVVDADTLVSGNLLRAFAAHFSAGAAALQAEYGPRNPGASWRTRLLRLALVLFHGVRSLGRQRLGLSCGLRGNGMGFSARLLREVPHDAFSIVEDLEYGIRLGLSGYRVEYVPEVQILGDMPASERASRSQRRRWEGGRLAVARQQLGVLLRRGIRERSPVLLDLAADLLVPPLATLVLVCGAGLVFVAAAGLAGAKLALAPWLWGAASFGVVVYVGRGLALAEPGARGLADLAWAPAYIAWKLWLALSPESRPKTDWVRTEREQR